MQRRLRNTLAIAIAGGAVIIGAGTAAAASPADDLTGSASQLGSVTQGAGHGKSKSHGQPTDELGSVAPDLGSATGSLPTGDLTQSAPALGGLGN
jgi:hypothetical protein